MAVHGCTTPTSTMLSRGSTTLSLRDGCLRGSAVPVIYNHEPRSQCWWNHLSLGLLAYASCQPQSLRIGARNILTPKLIWQRGWVRLSCHLHLHLPLSPSPSVSQESISNDGPGASTTLDQEIENIPPYPSQHLSSVRVPAKWNHTDINEPPTTQRPLANAFINTGVTSANGAAVMVMAKVRKPHADKGKKKGPRTKALLTWLIHWHIHIPYSSCW